MDWLFPLKMNVLGTTSDLMSFKNIDLTKEVEIPIGKLVGAFGVERKFDVHRGIDLYAPVGTPVFSVEEGKIIQIGPWTGAAAGCDWWLDTDAVYVEGESGVVAYGEIEVVKELEVDQVLKIGTLVGFIKRVLKKDKGRPTSMLHLQLYKHGHTSSGGWELGNPQPEFLKDPTPYLIMSKDNF